MTNSDIMSAALLQSSFDCGCRPEDFLKNENTLVISRVHPKARVYVPQPAECDLVSYGHGIVAQTSPELQPLVADYINNFPAEHCFETPNMLVLEDALRPHGLRICFMAEYFLPDVEKLVPIPCSYPLRVLHPEDFSGLYLDCWSNALCLKRRHLDMLAVGAYDGDRLIGLAGVSADCGEMYQIGVDVLPEYRGRGVASAIVSRIALETVALGKVPFYCAAWSNLASVRCAIKCGFRPAWVELTARREEFVNSINAR